MEISLEKIELVKDRTGVSYKEAKEALIRADGNVVDAIIIIEDDIDIKPRSKAGGHVFGAVEKIKEVIRTGNVSRIIIKRSGETILNIPVSFGVIGAVLVPWTTIAAAAVALGSKCEIEILKEDGESLDISGTAREAFCDVKENSSVIVGDLRNKSGDALSQVKDRVSGVINRVKPGHDDTEDRIFDDLDVDDADDVDDVDDVDDFNDAGDVGESGTRESAEEFLDEAEESAGEAADGIEEPADIPSDEPEDKTEKAEEEAEENAEAVSDSVDEEIEENVGENADETESESEPETEPEQDFPKSSLSFKIDESELDDEYGDERQSAAELLDEAIRNAEEMKDEETAELQQNAEETAETAEKAEAAETDGDADPAAEAVEDADAGERFEEAMSSYKSRNGKFTTM